MNAGFLTIFKVKQVHLETVKDVDLTCIDQDQQVPSEIPSKKFNRVHVLIDLRLHKRPRHLEALGFLSLIGVPKAYHVIDTSGGKGILFRDVD